MFYALPDVSDVLYTLPQRRGREKVLGGGVGLGYVLSTWPSKAAYQGTASA